MHRDDFCTVTGADADPARQLQRLERELHAAVTDLERVLAGPAYEGLALLDSGGDLIVSVADHDDVGQSRAVACVLREAFGGAATAGAPWTLVRRRSTPRARPCQ